MVALVKEHDDFLFGLTYAVVIVNFLIIVSIFIKAGMIENHTIGGGVIGSSEKGEKGGSHIINKVLCFWLISIKTYLHMPMADVILRSLYSAYNTTDIDSTTHAIRYLVCALSLLMFGSVMLYIFRIFHICVPSDILPWCAPFSKLTYLTLCMKFVVVISVTLDTAGDYAIAEVTALLILLGFQSGYRIMFVPQYSKEVDIVIKSKDFLLTLLFLIGILCRLLTDKYALDVVYFIIFSVVVTVAWSTADQLRRR